MIRTILPVMLAACSPAAGDIAASQVPDQNTEKPVVSKRAASTSQQAVSGLPFSHGKSFLTLDEYLTHLERYAAPIDQPWWREISPGVYEHVKRLPGTPRERATREQLTKRFGFSR